MQIRFNSIPVDVPSKKTSRIFTREVLQDITNQINIATAEIPIINHVGDRTEWESSRSCGTVIKGSANIVDNVLTMEARFFNKDFFLAHPYEFSPELVNIDPTSGNMMEKLTLHNMIEYSPVGTGEVDIIQSDGIRKFVVKNYNLLYVYGQPKGILE